MLCVVELKKKEFCMPVKFTMASLGLMDPLVICVHLSGLDDMKCVPSKETHKRFFNKINNNGT